MFLPFIAVKLPHRFSALYRFIAVKVSQQKQYATLYIGEEKVFAQTEYDTLQKGSEVPQERKKKTRKKKRKKNEKKKKTIHYTNAELFPPQAYNNTQNRTVQNRTRNQGNKDV